MKRWPIIRHVRYFLLARQFNLWWTTVGHKLGAVPNQADYDYLERVWRGEE